MTQTVWLHYHRPRPHWYDLSETDRAAWHERWAAVSAPFNGAGARREGLFHIRGQHDFELVAIWRFPSASAAFDYWAALCAEGYHTFFAFSNTIGREETG